MIDFSDIEGVIFDLDGTLVESGLNFRDIRKKLGCPTGVDILTFVEDIEDAVQKDAAAAFIVEQELADAHGARWLSKGKALVEALQAEGVPMAIVTRNSRNATTIKIETNQIPITTVITREDAPAKPDPTALLQIAANWGLHPSRCLYVGDFDYDRIAAERAGMQFLLV
ncbi:HAD family hydrolase [Salinimonas iocasae]|uniref:HAD family hydrolase n=1 Tax=Salinimonas iocasae TaxID=2572577 RepID=A0A5B7YHR9_9ALTE|nr:HAD-IA family hydrolase [Salinimonas iocasae]QCZ94870.1 HAD family hydrolase [Salinimonas iocasae]